MSKHTPGPWADWGEKNGYAITGPAAANCSIAFDAVEEWREKNEMAMILPITVSAKNATAPALAFGNTNEEAQANARLIAAAPELLESLKEILYYIGDRKVATHGAMHRARAAIDKAIGEQP